MQDLARPARDPALHERAIELLMEREKYDEALLLCEKALALGPNAGNYLRRARVQLALGDRQELRRSLEAAAELEPRSVVTRLWIADMLESAAEYEAAIGHLERALRLEPDSTEGLLRLGRLRLWRGEYGLAAAHAARTLKRDERSAPARRIRGAAALLNRRYGPARGDLDAALMLDAGDIEAYIWRGELERLQGRLDEALEDFRRAREIWPHPMGAIVNTELVQIARGQPLAAFEHDMMFTRVPKEILGWSGQGSENYDPARARRELEGALERMKGNRSLKTTYVWGRGRSRRLIEHLHFFPRDGLMNLQATVRFGDFRRVLGLFGEIIAANPDEAYPYSHRGEVLLWSGLYREAFEDFKRARALNDYLLWPKVGLGAASLLMGDLPQAERFIEYAAQWATDSIISTWRGELLRRLGRHEVALAELDKIREPLPFRPAVWLNKGLALAALGRADAAADILLRLRRHAPAFIADAEHEAGADGPPRAPEAAARVLEKALELMRGNRSSWLYGYVRGERMRIIRIRGAAPESVPSILRGYPWAFES